MSQKNVNICCTQYRNGACMHPEVPKSRFGISKMCIKEYFLDVIDPRVGLVSKCKIRVPFERPNPPLMPPKAS